MYCQELDNIPADWLLLRLLKPHHAKHIDHKASRKGFIWGNPLLTLIENGCIRMFLWLPSFVSFFKFTDELPTLWSGRDAQHPAAGFSASSFLPHCPVLTWPRVAQCSSVQQDSAMRYFSSYLSLFFELTQLYAGEALKWSSKVKSEFYILWFFRAWDFGCQSVSVSAGAGTVTMKRKVIIWMMQFVSLCFCIHWVYIACVNGTYATWWSALAILPPHFTRQSILRPSNLCEWLSILRVIICQIR